MPYVMVPVPEEHVQEVMQFVLRAVARASIEPWDVETMTEFFTMVDEPSRMLLSVVSDAVRKGRNLTDREVADLVELNPREVGGMVRELNEIAQESNRSALVFFKQVPEVLPNGRTREKRVVGMNDDVAVLVHEAEKAELAGDGATR
jgi:hypothetical protein